MWAAWLLFLLLWVGFLWMPKSSVPVSQIKVQTPVFQQNCSSKQVQCVDDCSFLCVEKQARCVGGVCMTDEQAPVECNTYKGGRLMLASDSVARWICLCTDETFWSGTSCNDLNPDVCEHGAFLYNARDDYLCICPEPYKKVVLNGKPHCLENHMSNFFQEDVNMLNESIGPTTR